MNEIIGNGDRVSINVGDKNDQVSVPYAVGVNSILAHLNTAYWHFHGQSFAYPNHADSVLLTAGTGAWDLTGSITEVIPAGALNIGSFDLHFVNISAISANGEIQIDIFRGGIGSEVQIGETRSQRNTNQARENANVIQIPQQIANERISCRLSDGTVGALTTNVSFEGHYYV